MNLSLDQLKVLDCLHHEASVSKAAKKLQRVHSAILYTMKQLEDQTELKLFDRSQYRTTLTAAGIRIWEESQKILASERELHGVIRTLKDEWEPVLKIVYDGILPVSPILKSLRALEKQGATTKVLLFSDYLSKVENTFLKENADLMMSLLPTEIPNCKTERLSPLESVLVAHKNHPLCQKGPKKDLHELQNHTYLTVRGSDSRLHLSTAMLEAHSQFHLSDFSAKKTALIEGLGYGWMPKYLIQDELKKGTLCLVPWKGKSIHTYHPLLVYGGNKPLGRAGQAVLQTLCQYF